MFTYVTILIEDTGDNEIYVDFWASVDWENTGIGSYEYCGFKGYDKGENVPLMEDTPKWDEQLYTQEQNALIKEWVDNNEDVWVEEFEKQALKDGYPEKDDYDQDY